MKLCAVICTAIASSLIGIAQGAEITKSKPADMVKPSEEASPFADGETGYDLVCPLFTILDFGDGFLEYINAYPHNCNDIPLPGYGIFDPEPVPCDCPNIDGCEKAAGFHALYDRVKPLRSKVPSDGPIPGLNNRIVVCKSVPAYFIQNDEPVYIRIIEMVYIDKDAPQKTRSFMLGLEMKSPLNGIEDLTEIKEVRPTELPFAYTIRRASQTILVICTESVGNGKDKHPKIANSAHEQQ